MGGRFIGGMNSWADGFSFEGDMRNSWADGFSFEVDLMNSWAVGVGLDGGGDVKSLSGVA